MEKFMNPSERICLNFTENFSSVTEAFGVVRKCASIYGPRENCHTDDEKKLKTPSNERCFMTFLLLPWLNQPLP